MTAKNVLRLVAMVGLIIGGLFLPACQSIGPSTVPRDRADYSSAVADSWKRQTLLNIVKLRYLDPPIFVDVGQIVAGYSLETSVSAGGGWDSDGSTGIFGAAGRFTDRPTITYSPLTGNDFIKGLMTPVPPDSVFFMIQAGYPADGVLLGIAASLNGLKNQHSGVSGTSAPQPEFLRVLALLRKIQASGALAMRVEAGEKTAGRSILTIHRDPDGDPELLAAGQEIRRLLKLDPDATEFELVFAATQSNPRELAVVTRSMVQLMGVLASQVDVPPEHLAEGRAVPGWESASEMPGATRLIRIESSVTKPTDAAVSVEYRDHWYWIDDRDLRSKHTFTLMMMMFALASTGPKDQLPLITIPAQ